MKAFIVLLMRTFLITVALELVLMGHGRNIWLAAFMLALMTPAPRFK